MSGSGRVLHVGQDVTLAATVGDLSCSLGAKASTVAPGAAAEALARQRFDLLILEVSEMGEAELHLLRSLSTVADGAGAIVILDEPSADLVIRLSQLHLAPCIAKPVDHEELRDKMRSGLQRAQLYRAIVQRVEQLHNDLGDLQNAADVNSADPGPVSVQTIVDMLCHNAASALACVRQTVCMLSDNSQRMEVCRVHVCPRLRLLLEAMQDSISVLEGTKRSFKSKDLGDLRSRLSRLVQQIEEMSETD